MPFMMAHGASQHQGGQAVQAGEGAPRGQSAAGWGMAWWAGWVGWAGCTARAQQPQAQQYSCNRCRSAQQWICLMNALNGALYWPVCCWLLTCLPTPHSAHPSLYYAPCVADAQP